MFTGIIEAVGTIAAIQRHGKGARLEIAVGDWDLSDVKLGDSIATDGVCLTVVALKGDRYSADLSQETLDRTSYAHAKVGSRVNLEKAMLPTTRFGGHIVSGHVDGLGTVLSRTSSGEAVEFWLRAPDELARYIAEKGSITVNGISLTVNEVRNSDFRLTIIPHTLTMTSLDKLGAGGVVNLEVDLLARYLERLLQARSGAGNLTWGKLAELGFGMAPSGTMRSS